MNIFQIEQHRVGSTKRSEARHRSTHYSKTIQPTLELGFFEHLSDGVMVLDGLHRILAINSALTHMVGWEKDELIGKPCLQIFGCQHPDNGMPMCQGFCPAQAAWLDTDARKEDLPNHLEVSINCKGGGRRHMSVSFSALRLDGVNGKSAEAERSNRLTGNAPDVEKSPLPPDSLMYTLVIMRDITEHKRIEQVKNQFLVTASHQLRTPLAAIKASVGFLLDHVEGKLDGPLLRLLHNIQSSSMHMERLVSDLIELTNLQSGLVRLQDEWLEANYIVQKAVETTQERLMNKGQALEIALPQEHLYVRGDGMRLTKILSHLLSNASKFSPPGSPIKLRVALQAGDAASMGEPEVVFSVTDRGRGVSMEEQKLIFEKFYQSEVAENANGDGIGLGLPLARALVELHGGRLWLESTLGQGSTFYFALPSPGHKKL
jgi:signal transduction histidine kinase